MDTCCRRRCYALGQHWHQLSCAVPTTVLSWFGSYTELKKCSFYLVVLKLAQLRGKWSIFSVD